MSSFESNISVSLQHSPQRKQRIGGFCVRAVLRFSIRLACDFHYAYVEQLSPRHVTERNLRNFLIPVWHILKQFAFARLALADAHEMHVDNDCAIFEVQVHVLADIRFSAVQTEAFHACSPLHVSVGEGVPALSTNRQFLALDLDVQFNVLTLAVIIPRIFAVFQTINSNLLGLNVSPQNDF